jgi:FkbM family methyltransferase
MSESYLKTHYTLRHRLVAAISNRLDSITYTQRHGLIRGMKRKGGLGFLPAVLSDGGHESAEHRFLRSLDLSQATVYEVGAFQGILTLFFSGRAKEVIAYEPNPSSYRRVLENLRLNGRTNVRVRNLAVSDAEGSITLLCDALMPGGASADPVLAQQMRGSSPQVTSITVRAVALDEDIVTNHFPPPDFVKIDIEGMELPALRGMRQVLSQYRPALYLEMHGATIEHKNQNVRAIVDFLLELGYEDIVHVESGEQVFVENATRAREGHLYCTARAPEAA